jgi:hypothetical protein
MDLLVGTCNLWILTGMYITLQKYIKKNLTENLCLNLIVSYVSLFIVLHSDFSHVLWHHHRHHLLLLPAHHYFLSFILPLSRLSGENQSWKTYNVHHHRSLTVGHDGSQLSPHSHLCADFSFYKLKPIPLWKIGRSLLQICIWALPSSCYAWWPYFSNVHPITGLMICPVGDSTSEMDSASLCRWIRGQKDQTGHTWKRTNSIFFLINVLIIS